MSTKAPKVPEHHIAAPGCRCSIYVERSLYRPGVTGKEPCRERVVFWIYAPDGKPVPGNSVCAAHGASIHNELLTKLGEDWPLVPVVEDSTALRQQQLVAHAAEAAEVFDEDELEAFAAKQREGAGS